MTLEGGEGVGKSTNLALVESIVRAAGKPVLVTREPGGRLWPRTSARCCSNFAKRRSPPPVAELLADVRRPGPTPGDSHSTGACRGSTGSVCDRFTDATYAYQGGGRGARRRRHRQTGDAGAGPLATRSDNLSGCPRSRWPSSVLPVANTIVSNAKQRQFYERVRSAYLARAVKHDRIEGDRCLTGAARKCRLTSRCCWTASWRIRGDGGHGYPGQTGRGQRCRRPKLPPEAFIAFPPWLEPCLQRILRLRELDKLPHGLLIRAHAGWGEVELASRIALELLGRVNAEDGRVNAEDARVNAEDARALAHPDLLWIQPEGSVIKVDEVRRLNHFADRHAADRRCKGRSGRGRRSDA